MRQQQPDLFEEPTAFPSGFCYRPELIDDSQARALVSEIEKQDLAPFDFHGFLGKRRVRSFGWSYSYSGTGLHKSREIPPFLLPLRSQVALAFKRDPAMFEHVLLTEYQPGAPIGWHKDRPEFGDVVGVSLVSLCTFRFRKKAGARWDRRTLILEPNSAYLLHGAARTEWEHSIPPVDELRYSITFRSLKRNRA